MSDDRLPFSITFSGRDAPGLLSRICDILTELDCQLADTRIAQLVGECVGILVVYAPADASHEAISTAFEPVRSEGIQVDVREPPDDGWVSYKTPFTKPYMVSYEGAHRPDITQALAHALSDAGCHFMDVSIDSALGDRSNAFVLVCELEAPLERVEIEAIVSRVGEDQGVELTVIPSDMDEIASGVYGIP